MVGWQHFWLKELGCNRCMFFSYLYNLTGFEWIGAHGKLTQFSSQLLHSYSASNGYSCFQTRSGILCTKYIDILSFTQAFLFTIALCVDEGLQDTAKGDLLQEYKNLVLTPGMVARIVRPQGHSNNYLMSIILPSNDKNTWGLAYADFSTGHFS